MLIRRTAEERALARTWQRRVELGITEHMYNGFRYAEGHEMFKNRLHCIPAAAGDLKAAAQEKLTWLDALMGDKPFICGDALRFVDLTLYCCMDFVKDVGQPLNPKLTKVHAWFQRLDARPSAISSLHPASAEARMRG